MKLSPARALSIAAVALVVGACSGSGGSPSTTASSASAPPASAVPSAPVSPAAPGGPSAAASPAGEVVTVTGVEYAFEGAPDTAATGTQFAFTNGGKELHELVLVRKNEGVTESWEQLLQLPDDQALSKVTMVGQVMAEPGQDAEGTVTVDAPGDYLMLCFVPVGMTALPSGSIDPSALPTGAPHFTEGMLHELTVD